MATELKVPTLGMDMEEATIVRWLVEEGAEVKKGDPVLEIDTDKTSFEIEAPADGSIRAIRGAAGETLAVGATLAFVAAPGEEIPDRQAPATAEVAEPPGQTAAAGREASERQPAPAVADSENGRKVRASPAARRAAAQMGVSIETVFPLCGSVPANETTPSAGARTVAPAAAAMSIPRCCPPA